MFITEFTPSVIRAGILGILMLGSKIIYRKADIITSMAFALLLSMFQNPYSLFQIGLQLSYLATIGILFGSSLTIKKKEKNKKLNHIKQSAWVCISAQIFIFPVMVLNFHTVTTYFVIANLLVSPFIGIVLPLGFFLFFVSFFSDNLTQFVIFILNFLLQIMQWLASTIAKIPLATIWVKTPYWFSVITYYIISLWIMGVAQIKHRVLKRWLLKYKKKMKNILIILIIVCILVTFLCDIPRNLTIHFIDVGQGDSCLIITAGGKRVLVDGGGSEFSTSFDLGEKILLPYLLNHRINFLDYMVISHFDSDHCRTGYLL